MGYLNNQIVTVDAILTKKGRELLALGGDAFTITQFALSDDEVDYTLYNPNHPSGSAYYGEAIENMPLLEAFPDETQMMKYKLVTLPRGTATMPTIGVVDNVNLVINENTTITPTTIDYLIDTNVEPAGYQFTISDVRVFQTFTGNGVTTDNATILNNTSIIITNGTATSSTRIGYNVSLVATGVQTLFAGSNNLYATLTIIGLNSGARAQIPVTIRNSRTK
tara:strand:+ start:67 stop:732 length:666 start_codon:yes stop_codon:yes gene_type:complete